MRACFFIWIGARQVWVGRGPRSFHSRGCDGSPPRAEGGAFAFCVASTRQCPQGRGTGGKPIGDHLLVDGSTALARLAQNVEKLFRRKPSILLFHEALEVILLIGLIKAIVVGELLESVKDVFIKEAIPCPFCVKFKYAAHFRFLAFFFIFY